MSEPDFYEDFAKKPETRPRPTSGPVVPLDPNGSAYGQAALQAELNAVANAQVGQRNHQLNASAFNLAQLVASGHLPDTSTWDAVHATAVAIGLPWGEVDATMHSAWSAGKEQPREVAPNEQYQAPPVTELAVPEGAAVPDVEAEFPAVDWAALYAATNDEEWLVEPLIPARRLVAIYSAPKVGKSLLLLELAVQVSRGAPVFGGAVTTSKDDGSGRVVLYVDFENDLTGDIRPRLEDLGIGAEVAPAMLANLKYLSFPTLPYLDTPMGGMVLLNVVRHYGAELVVIDTISRAVGGEENENDTWLAFYRNTGRLLKAEGVACVRLDHTGKDHSKGMRGGSAKYGDVDAVWAMTLDGDQVRLECTANRLPIRQKIVELTRKERPLMHVLDRRTRHQLHQERVDVALAVLRDLDWPTEVPAPPGKGMDHVWEPVQAHRLASGLKITRAQAREALKRHQGGDPDTPTEVHWTDR